MARFYFGQIVSAYIDDGRGHTKERPVVIISVDDEYQVTGELLVVPITKRPASPCPFYHVPVHHGTVKDSDTGLYYPCWAKSNWARWIEIRRIHSTWGHLPDDLSDKIANIYDTLYADDAFTDWQ